MADSNLIELIKLLRERTGAGLMDCKGALEANDLDLDKACDWLREKGLVKVANKADRIAAEGLALTSTCPKCGKVAIYEVNCETDFVSSSDAFKSFAGEIGSNLLANEPSDPESAMKGMESLFSDATVKIGEKLSLRRFEIIHPEGETGIYTYIHMGGKIAVALVLAAKDDELGKQLAMHVAANSPKYVKMEDIPADVLSHEKDIQLEAAKNDPKLSSRPPEMLSKIIDGKVSKIFQEVTLSEQPFLMDDTKTVGEVLKEKNNSVLHFVRYAVGEGIEKKQDSFVEEVMNQVNA
ncbi:MAG: translation elongation factor Ts [Coprobacillus sp.]|nr:translation elongation factor Ts [Coprobacillus sp.]